MSKPVTQSAPGKKVFVMGAGIAGACTAFHLQKQGFDVTIFDKREPGTATSWGNAGLIQAKCNLPYPFPKGLTNQVKMALNLKNDIRYNPSALFKYAYPIFDYWYCSLPHRYPKICHDLNTLVAHSTTEQEYIFKTVGCEDLIARAGFVEVYRHKSHNQIEETAVEKRKHDIVVDVITQAALQKMEPHLSKEFQGGIHFKDTLLVKEPGRLVHLYVDYVIENGGKHVKENIQTLKPPASGAKNWKLTTDSGSDFEAPLVVICTGPWAGDTLRPLGYKFPLYPLRGYNAHFKLKEGAATLNGPVEDYDTGFFLGPMHQGIRLTTGGEFTNMDSPPNEKQLRHSEEVLRSILPVEKQVGGVWYGHRPCVSDMKPIIGPSKHEGLWFNFGHAHSGLTLGGVSARLLSQLMTDSKTIVDPAPFSPSRF